MAGTYAGQFAMQGLLHLRCSRALRLMITRTITIVPLLLLLLFNHETLDAISEGVNVLQALLLPLAVVPLVVFNASPKAMGPFALQGWRRLVATTLGLSLAAINCTMVVVGLSSAALSLSQRMLLILALFLYIAILILAFLLPVKGSYCLCLSNEVENYQGGPWGHLADVPDTRLSLSPSIQREGDSGCRKNSNKGCNNSSDAPQSLLL